MDRASEQESGRNARESAEQVGFAGHAELPDCERGKRSQIKVRITDISYNEVYVK